MLTIAIQIYRFHTEENILYKSFLLRHFGVAVELGCGRGHIGKHILADTVSLIIQTDMAEDVLVSKIILHNFSSRRNNNMNTYLFDICLLCV